MKKFNFLPVDWILLF